MNTVPVSKPLLVDLLVQLEYLVVSLDHIGSLGLSADKRAKLVDEFVVKGRVFEQLASMRKVISELVDSEYSKEETSEVDERIARVVAWNSERRGQ